MAEKKAIVDWDHTDLGETKWGEVEFDNEKCIGCTWCVKACPSNAIELSEDKARMTLNSQCAFCGCCQAICSEQAITLKKRPDWPGYFVILDRGEAEKPRVKFD